MCLLYGAAGLSSSWNSRSRLGKYSWSWLRTIGLSDYLLERTAKEKNDQGRRDPGIDIQDMENLSVFTGTGIAGSTIFVFMVLAAVARLGAEDVAVYEKYHRLYQKLYTSLKNDYKELAELS